MLCAKCHFCTSNWASPSKFWPLRRWAQPWLSDLGFIVWWVSIPVFLFPILDHKPSRQADFCHFFFFFSSCSYIFPFVKLASYALMISSKSAFIPFKLFLLISLSILLSFFFLSLSGPVQVYGVLEIILGSRACGSPTCWSFAQSHANCPVLSMLLQVSLGVSQSVP